MRAIDRYAAIGDGRSIALISDQGAIEWLCWPRVDSPSLFAAMLDDGGGTFSVAPAEPFHTTRRYLDGTNVLVTMMETARGTIEVCDFMPADDEEAKGLAPERELVRRVSCLDGEVPLTIVVDPRPDFARRRPSAIRTDALGVRWRLHHGVLDLRCDVRLELDRSRASTTISLVRGARIDLALTHATQDAAVLPVLGARIDDLLDRTTAWWRRWSARARYDGPFQSEVIRSALALKLLCFSPSGAIVAAPTTSLPERPGGPLQWDYRFCWLRDASLTARALFGLGYVEEARAFVEWLLHATRLSWPRLHVLYDVYGRSPPPEQTLANLSGYFGARPVRVGNAAHHQLQLDLYGEVIDATAQLYRTCGSLDADTREMLSELGEQVLRAWMIPDQGIWEPRAPAAHHTHSRLLSWVAVDRLLELHRGKHALVREPRRYEDARAAIRHDIETRAWSNALTSYVGILDSDSEADLDASTLLLSFYGFERADSPRMRATYDRLRSTLGTPRGLRRYVAPAGWEEGAFGVCGFWAADHLARGGGSIDETRSLLGEMLSTSNDVGLFSEEVDPVSGALLGNFPQGFTHIGAINAALTLRDRLAERWSRPALRELPHPVRDALHSLEVAR